MLNVTGVERKRTDEMWPLETTGTWADDNALGRAYAKQILDQIVLEDNPVILGHIVKSIMKKGYYDGTAVGFFQYISENLIHGALTNEHLILVREA